MLRQIILLSIFLFLQYIRLNEAQENEWDPEVRNKAKHQLFLNLTKTLGNEIKLIFFGDSITEGWNWTAPDIWQQYYGNLGAVNYGVAGIQYQHIISRLNDKEIDGLKPKVVVLMIGTNNLGGKMQRSL